MALAKHGRCYTQVPGHHPELVIPLGIEDVNREVLHKEEVDAKADQSLEESQCLRHTTSRSDSVAAKCPLPASTCLFELMPATREHGHSPPPCTGWQRWAALTLDPMGPSSG